MNNPNFTPGPWFIDFQDSFEDCTITAETRSGMTEICSIDSVYEDSEPQNEFEIEQLANASLIAAAPDMYEALYQILDRDECFLSEILCEFEIKDARAALAKARGENEPNKPNI